MTMTHVSREYTFRRSGDYSNRAPIEFDPAIHGRPGPKRQSGPGKICIACGIERSRANKCECNS